MISGVVSGQLDAQISLVLIDNNGGEHPIVGTIDTGFTGCLALSTEHIKRLGWRFSFDWRVTLGDGSQHDCAVHSGKIRWLNESRDIWVEAAEIEPLIGMSLLEGNELTIKVVRGGSVAIRQIQ